MKKVKTINLLENYESFDNKDSFFIYTDAGYSMKRKKACMARKLGDKNVEVMRNISVPKIEGLKQYINLMELRAVLWALEETPVDKDVELFTDSTVVVGWVNKEKNKLGKLSKYHEETKKKIDEIKAIFKSFTINWVSREENPAGKALEY